MLKPESVSIPVLPEGFLQVSGRFHKKKRLAELYRLRILDQDLPANGFVQLDRVLRSVSSSSELNARAEVRLISPVGSVVAYATSIDNRTGDPVMQLAWPVEETGEEQ